MMGTEIFKIDASWVEKLTKTRVPFLSTPTVGHLQVTTEIPCQSLPDPCLSFTIIDDMNIEYSLDALPQVHHRSDRGGDRGHSGKLLQYWCLHNLRALALNISIRAGQMAICRPFAVGNKYESLTTCRRISTPSPASQPRPYQRDGVRKII